MIVIFMFVWVPIFSETFSQEMGVSQGNIVPVTLISTKNNSIVFYMKTSTEGFLYVDDFSISYRLKHMYVTMRYFEFCITVFL
ncbi:hypothetical protein BOV88_13685 [Solemya velum gill symbiont]|uniref:Uncharacterized protein n=1 Tax=Solemya velum gill symbiont TaxID=2340 RepID=A0A1T2CFU2_SOVGS|nr:hypothetical protein BOV88_13685 [Solemya velum gill symbiont]